MAGSEITSQVSRQVKKLPRLYCKCLHLIDDGGYVVDPSQSAVEKKHSMARVLESNQPVQLHKPAEALQFHIKKQETI